MQLERLFTRCGGVVECLDQRARQRALPGSQPAPEAQVFRMPARGRTERLRRDALRQPRRRARLQCQFDDRIDQTCLLGMMHASRQQRRSIGAAT